jgi:hypothetical protein
MDTSDVKDKTATADWMSSRMPTYNNLTCDRTPVGISGAGVDWRAKLFRFEG